MIYSGGSEFSAWLRKPYNRRIFRYYLTEILDKYQARGPRVDAWFDCEQAVSSTYNPNQNKYTGWDSGRRNRILSELSNGHTRKLDVDPIANTANDTVTITGEAGYRVWEVAVENHPEGKFSWIDETTWKIEGVSLSTGSNAFRVIALDDDGKPAYGEETDTFTVNKANNAAPAIVLDLNPGSGNVELSGTLVLDASESYDPEGDALSFVWGSLSDNVIITTDGPIAVASFSAPGLYELSLVATDQKDQTSAISREISVFGPESFSAFSSVWLDPWIQEHDIEQKDNYSPGAWWSLNESQGKLVIQLPDDKSYPLGLPPGISTAKSYIQLDHTWKYSDTNIDYMSDFSKVDFDDSSWKTGKGMFGKDSGTIPEPGINTPLQSNSAENLVSYYFRTEFEFSFHRNIYLSIPEKSYSIYNSKLGIKLGSYRWIRLSHRYLPEYYLRNFIDRDYSLYGYYECLFSSESFKLSYSHPISRKTWLRLKYGKTRLLYDSHFSEFDVEIQVASA